MIKELGLHDDVYINKLIALFPKEVYDIKKNIINNPFAKYIVYIFNNEIIGMLNYDLIYDRIEIINVIVDDQYRRRGIATSLFEYLFESYNDIKNITLEVRKNNFDALNLYLKLGFKQVAIRKNYYENEDGLLMEKEMM